MKKFFLIIFAAIILLLSIGLKTFDYNKNEIQNTAWTVTQYGEKNMPQMMCFTIEGNENGLVVIDGGYKDSEEDVNRILEVASKHNNEIDAWIVTHLDSDHVGVCLNIIDYHPEIKIDKIYTTNVPTFEKAQEKFPQETEWEPFQEFTALELDNIEWLKENDEIANIIGLKMKVLWAYSDWIYDNCTNLLNNGSLVFKLYGNEENMLFCGDTQQKVIEEQIMKNHREELKSDYLQVGHHGNNCFSKKFYEEVSPKSAYFSAPKELMENANQISWYTADKIESWLTKRGCQTFCHETAPNSFVMK